MVGGSSCDVDSRHGESCCHAGRRLGARRGTALAIWNLLSSVLSMYSPHGSPSVAGFVDWPGAQEVMLKYCKR